jgi:hypothetical protein
MWPPGVSRRRNTFGLAGAVIAACAACLASSAATSAPSAITGTVSTVTPSGATLNGTVNPNGLATSWSFEYGATTSYGSQTSSQSLAAGTTDSAVSVTLSGLTPGTSYHYRLDATSSAGTSTGSDGIFTTPSAPGVVTGAATSVAGTSATLNGTVDPNGEPTTYSFQYGTTAAYGSSTAQASIAAGTSVISVSAPVSGLAASQTYHFRLIATSAAGSTDGPDMSFKLASPPSATTSPTVAISGTSARLSGTVNPDGQATTWVFQYGVATSYGATTATVSAGSGSQPVNVSATIAGLAAATIYHFRLVAKNATGTSNGSDESFGSSPPPLVETGSAEGGGPTSITLTGAVNPKGGKTTWYFQYGLTTTYGGTSALTSGGSGAANESVSVQVVKLQPTTTYHYRLVASNGAGTSYGGDVSFTTPSAVTLIAESSQSVYGHAVTLSGTAAGSPAGAKITVLSQPLGQASFSSVATVTTASGGAWSFQARPGIVTTYEASTSSGTSIAVTIGVRPAITLRRITGARLLIRVVASTPFTGRVIQLQRLRPQGGWDTVVRSRLNARSSAVVAMSVLPRGSSTIRIAMSVNEAGRGFLAGFSRSLLVTRS